MFAVDMNGNMKVCASLSQDITTSVILKESAFAST